MKNIHRILAFNNKTTDNMNTQRTHEMTPKDLSFFDNPYEMLQWIIQVTLQQTMADNGYTPNEILAQREVELTLGDDTNLVTEVEIWSNTKRTKGYKKLTPSEKTQKMAGLMLGVWQEMQK